MNAELVRLPRAMAWQDGTVYLASPSGVAAVATATGETTDLGYAGAATGVWVEGDNVLYSYDDQLYSVPRAGGESTLLLDGGQHNDPSSGSSGQDHVGDQQYLDATAFYWTTRAYPYATDGMHVWRMPRAGVGREGFALFPIQTLDALAIRTDGVLAAGQATTMGGPFYRAFLAPFGHGAARELPLDPLPDKILSATNGGLLWSRYTGDREGGRETHEIWMSAMDGSPAWPLSRALPVELQASWAMPDELGGHVLGGVERFDDGEMHASVFQVKSDGSATRLACDSSSNWPVYTATALAPDAIYLSVRYDQPGWKVIRLPRLGQQE
jgi:hypothetical protein